MMTDPSTAFLKEKLSYPRRQLSVSNDMAICASND